MQLSSDALRCIRVQEGGRLVAAGSDDGMISLLGVEEYLYMMEKSEKSIMASVSSIANLLSPYKNVNIVLLLCFFRYYNKIIIMLISIL